MKSLIISALLIGVVLAQKDPNFADDRSVIVHLFEWKWTSIAKECERLLGPYGFGGVQISPPNEHRIVYKPDWDPNVKRPWYESYQPISYKLETRRGTRSELIDMVNRCNNAGVRIYADVVVNHMCGTDAGIGTGSAGSSYDTSAYSFAGVPYSSDDFNVPKGKCNSHNDQISNYGDPDQVRNCNLVGLMDLDLSKGYVRQMITEYLNDLISIGIAGFRFDAAKHMWPSDLQAIMGMLNDLPTTYFQPGSRPFVYQEVIDLGGEAISSDEYTHLGRVTEFRYGRSVSEGVRDGGSNQLKNYKTFGSSWGMLSEGDALVFIDNHDNQRGHGAGGQLVTHDSPKYYTIAVTYMLAWPYGIPRVMSSYEFTSDWEGPPSDGNYVTNDPPINQDGSCAGRWICEHRWRAIKNMAKWRNIAGNEPVMNWWDNGYQQIAFSRGNKAFVALNRDWSPISGKLKTGLPKGEYCDLARGDFDDQSKTCSGPTVTVDSSGYANIYVDNNSDEPVLLIHVGAMGSSCSDCINPTPPPDSGDVTTPGNGGSVTSPPGSSRTTIFVYKPTTVGQDLFIRGGIDHSKRVGCTSSASSSACALPITHRTGGSNGKYNAWKTGDNYLDWYGAEPGQSSYNGNQADGSPMVWTTNKQGNGNVGSDGYGYTPVNQWGDHYWMLDVDMDCSKTENGWFEFKSYLKNGDGWESDRNQATSCSGTAGGSKPYSTGNHFARCGFVNVFNFNDNSCIINKF